MFWVAGGLMVVVLVVVVVLVIVVAVVVVLSLSPSGDLRHNFALSQAAKG